MSLPLPALRRPLIVIATLLTTLALMLAFFSLAPSASAMDDDATQTTQPTPGQDEGTDEPTGEEALGDETPLAVPVEDFVVDYVGPDCWDSSYNVYVEYAGDDTDLRLVLQEQVDGTWLTLRTERFYDGFAGVYSDWLEEGQSATFQVLVYDRSSPTEQTLLHGPVTTTGVSTDGCDDWEIPYLPEEEWTAAEAGCGSVTFTSRTDEEVAVIWMDEETEEENYFFLAPGQSQTVDTTDELVYWVSVTGLDDDLEPVADEISFAGEGEVEVEQDCAPEPGEPTTPVQPEPGDDTHKVPGTVQTDGGANTATIGLGLGLLSLAGLALVRHIA